MSADRPESLPPADLGSVYGLFRPGLRSVAPVRPDPPTKVAPPSPPERQDRDSRPRRRRSRARPAGTGTTTTTRQVVASVPADLAELVRSQPEGVTRTVLDAIDAAEAAGALASTRAGGVEAGGAMPRTPDQLPRPARGRLSLRLTTAQCERLDQLAEAWPDRSAYLSAVLQAWTRDLP